MANGTIAKPPAPASARPGSSQAPASARPGTSNAARPGTGAGASGGLTARPPTSGNASSARPPSRALVKAGSNAITKTKSTGGAEPKAKAKPGPEREVLILDDTKGVEATATPSGSPSAGRRATKRFSKAYTKDVEDVVDKLFALSDDDGSGAMDFGEFLVHHRNIMGVSEFAGTPADSDAKLEMRFREYDKDNSLTLDKEEFRLYMDSVLSVLGKRKFVEICQALYEETVERRAEIKKAFDSAVSERLLEKVRGANRILPELEQVCIGLLEKKADVNFCDPTGTSTLLYAIDKSENTFIGQLLKYKADPGLHSKEYDCAAFRASRGRTMENLRLVLLQNSEPKEDNQMVMKLSTALVRDMAQMSGADVTASLKKGAELNFRDQNGWTPLTAAVFWGKMDCFEALLKTQTQHCQVKLHLSMRNARGRAAIHIAARKGRSEMIVPLIKARTPVDLQDAEGWTALHHAIFNSMEDSLNVLLDNGAHLQIQQRAGLTPGMMAKMPDCVGKLTEKALRRLEVPESLSFAKAMLPALKDENKSVYDKLEALLDLPGVYRVPANLRLYEQCFDCRHGPNKIRLQKLWESLALPMIHRLQSQQTDLKPVPSNSGTDARQDRDAEMQQRMKEQIAFVKQWLIDTKGPRRTQAWKYDNREAYRDEFQGLMKEELERFKFTFAECYKELEAQPGGLDLIGRPSVEIMDGALTTQLQAHPLLPWLQRLDPASAFEALRMVGAASMGGDDQMSLLSFVDLLATNPDFDNGRSFWKNVYRLWLANYAQLANSDFQKRIEGLATRFAEANTGSSVTIAFRGSAPKSYERIHTKEMRYGENTHETYAGRTVAAQVMDLVRCSITVNSPALACRLIDEVFSPLTLQKDRLQVMKVVNRYSKDSNMDELMGFRNIELTMVMDSGWKPSACGRKDLGMQVKIIGEVQILLEDFLNIRKRRHLIFKAARGEFDWPEELEDEKGLGGKDDDEDWK